MILTWFQSVCTLMHSAKTIKNDKIKSILIDNLIRIIRLIILYISKYVSKIWRYWADNHWTENIIGWAVEDKVQNCPREMKQLLDPKLKFLLSLFWRPKIWNFINWENSEFLPILNWSICKSICFLKIEIFLFITSLLVHPF